MGYPSVKYQRTGEMYLLELAQKGMKVAGAKMLAADMLMEEDLLGEKVQTRHGRVKSSKSSCISILGPASGGFEAGERLELQQGARVGQEKRHRMASGTYRWLTFQWAS